MRRQWIQARGKPIPRYCVTSLQYERMSVSRRVLILSALAGWRLAAAGESMLRGRLGQQNGRPALETGYKGTVALTGDDPTTKVLNDERIRDFEIEVKGHFTKPAEFAIDPIETHSMVAIKGGKRYRVTYFCDVCAIRSFTPGLCVCCQQETRLDLIDPGQD